MREGASAGLEGMRWERGINRLPLGTKRAAASGGGLWLADTSLGDSWPDRTEHCLAGNEHESDWAGQSSCQQD